MQALSNNRQKAETIAVERGVAALAGVDLAARCAALRLASPLADGTVTVRVLGRELRLTPPAFSAVATATGKAARPADRILALHYLRCAISVEPTQEWISFREFPGGRFYWEPFLARSIRPLLVRIGNDLELLKRNLGRLDWRPADGRAFSARIQALGAIDALLVYRQGDEEFGPSADLLFDACAKRALCAEDAAVLAGRICMSLL
jgi:hypothetical protein